MEPSGEHDLCFSWLFVMFKLCIFDIPIVYQFLLKHNGYEISIPSLRTSSAIARVRIYASYPLLSQLDTRLCQSAICRYLYELRCE